MEVKKLHIGPLSLRTKVMRELRLLKDLRHENVNTFIGLFIDQNAPALIFEYGHRGSLEVRIFTYVFIKYLGQNKKYDMGNFSL